MSEEDDRGQEETRRLLHQLNQPLAAIGNYAQAGCQLLDSGQGDPVRLRALFDKIAAQSRRTVDISQSLKASLDATRRGKEKT